MSSHVFNLHLDNLTAFVLAQGKPSAFAREVIETAAQKGNAPTPLSGETIPVRLDAKSKRWLKESSEGKRTMAEIARACIAETAVQKLTESVELYKSGQADLQEVIQTIWMTLGYNASGAPASSRADNGGIS